jgi:hypothetical protein
MPGRTQLAHAARGMHAMYSLNIPPQRGMQHARVAVEEIIQDAAHS